jgi:hypothetical protein
MDHSADHFSLNMNEKEPCRERRKLFRPGGLAKLK